MKQTRLLEIIREEIAGALREDENADKKAKMAALAATQAEINALLLKKKEQMKGGVAESEELEEDNLNEVPDFGGKLDQGVAKEFGEKNTLQNAVDKIVDETLTDMGVTLEDLKKDKAKATEALTSIREKVLGAKRKNIPQDPRVTKALEKQEDVEVATLGAISGKSLQQNQTENAIKKALGLVTPGKQGRKADPNKPEKPASTGKKGRPAGEPKAEKVATRTPGDDGFDDVSYSDDEESAEAAKAAGSDKTAKELGKTSSAADKLANLFQVKTTEEAKDKLKELAKKANSGDQKAKAFFDNEKNQKIIQAYRKAQQVNI
jgi:hypothetical protein